MRVPTPSRHPDREDVLVMIRAAFVARDPGYPEKRKAAKDHLDGIEARLDELRANGAPTSCASKVMEEARWLTNYTEDWTGVDERCHRLDGLVAAPPADPVGQAPDGSWGACCDVPYRKLDPTVDALQLKATRSATPHPLTFMAKLQDPAALGRIESRSAGKLR